MSESPLKTRNVFLDTQAYDDNKLHFAGPALRKVKELGAGGFLKLLTTEVVDEEVRLHIKSALANALVSHERLKGHAGILQALPSGEHRALFAELELGKLLPLGLQVWEDFLAKGKVETLTVAGVSAAPLLELYFNQRPPFSDKKKAEFPDAISLLALKQWRKTTGAELYLISNDPDIKAWCDTHPGMHHVAYLKDFLDLYNRTEQRLSQIAVSIFEREEADIVSMIREAFVECTFLYAQNWEADVENVSIKSSSVDDVSVIEVDEHRFVLTLDVEIAFSAEISGHHYDHPEYPEYYHTRITSTDRYDVSFDATYDLSTEATVEIRDILFDDGTQITVPDPDSPYG